jgi:cysteine-rich repeat protein
VFCRDGIREGLEECDDLNHVDGDGCSPLCTLAPLGPYGVAHTDVSYSYFSAPFGAERRLDVRIWYPTAPFPMQPFYDDGPADVPAARGRFPLILESHGFAPGFTPEGTWNNTRDHFLARNGFIVAAPVHPGDDLFVFAQVLEARPQDLRFLLDRLLDPTTQPRLLRNRIDPDRIGAIGQSLGGITATATTVEGFRGSVRDPRVKAVVGTGSENYTFTATQLATSRVPIMLLIGTRDSFFFGGAAQVRATYHLHQAPRFMVEIVDGNHGAGYFNGGCTTSFCNAGPHRYMLAFFETYLRNDPSHAAILEPGAEAVFGGEVTWLRDPGPRLVLGGATRDDCMLELAAADGDGLDDAPVREIACTDGAACDADPAPGRCGVAISLCVNVVDRRLPRCVPTDVAEIAVKNPDADAELADVQAAATGLGATSHRRCTAPSRLTVGIPARRSRGQRRLRVLATDAAGRIDRDAFVVRCLRP